MPELDLMLDRGRLDDVRHGALLVTTDPAVFRITGAGAVTCLQGLLTNDLVKPGDGSLVYGALLTVKGMIVVDAWVLRQSDTLTLVIPRSGHTAAQEIFQRTLPPRLAKVTDLTGEARVAWILGGHAFQTLVKSGVRTPEGAGRVVTVGGDLRPVALALAPESAPFVAMAVGIAPALDAVVGRLLEAGASSGGDEDLDAARILSGWPALGVEIDERTLPQEVRYDELGGVSYTKGCYTGQEVVARLHFRGHTNRELKGVRWSGTDQADGRMVIYNGKDVGTLRSTLALDDRILGLAMVRREVSPGSDILVGGRLAKLLRLPFGAEDVDG